MSQIDRAVDEQREKLRWEAVRYALDHAPALFAHLEEFERGQYSWSVGASAGRATDKVCKDLQHALMALGKGGGDARRQRELVDTWDFAMLEQFKVLVTHDARPAWPRTPQTIEDVVDALEGAAANGGDW